MHTVYGRLSRLHAAALATLSTVTTEGLKIELVMREQFNLLYLFTIGKKTTIYNFNVRGAL